MTSNTMALAEKLTLRRARASIISGIFFLMSMAGSLGVDVPANRPETIRLAAWVIWAAALLFLLAAGGGLFRGKAIRALMKRRQHIGKSPACDSRRVLGHRLVRFCPLCDQFV
jgi:cation transport ATPase